MKLFTRRFLRKTNPNSTPHPSFGHLIPTGEGITKNNQIPLPLIEGVRRFEKFLKR